MTITLRIFDCMRFFFFPHCQLSIVNCQLTKLLGGLHDIHQFLKEPFINLCKFMHLIDGISCPESFRNYKNTFIGRFAQCLIEIRNNQFLVFYKAMHSLSDHAQSLLNSFFKSTSDGHHFPYRFHGRSQFLVYTMEFS